MSKHSTQPHNNEVVEAFSQLKKRKVDGVTNQGSNGYVNNVTVARSKTFIILYYTVHAIEI